MEQTPPPDGPGTVAQDSRPVQIGDLPRSSGRVVHAERVVVEATRGNARWDALSTLRTTAELERSVAARRDRQVAAARRAGASWTDIARVLGVSPQAVQQRYGKKSAG